MALTKQNILDYLEEPDNAIRDYSSLKPNEQKNFEREFNEKLKKIAVDTDIESIKKGGNIIASVSAFLFTSWNIGALGTGAVAYKSISDYAKHLKKISEQQVKNIKKINQTTHMKLSTDVPLLKIIKELVK